MSADSIVKKFIYLACIFGVLFLVLIPPFQAPDEDSHFKKAYVIAKGNLFPEIEDGKVGFYLPKGMIDYIEEQTNKGGDLDEKFDYQDIYLTERLPGEYGTEEFHSFSTAKTNPLAHIVPASGIVFGEFISWLLEIEDPSAVYYLYFARMFNLIAYIVIVSISIFISPILKRTFAMLGIMPMSLFLASTASYDTLLISLAFLVTAMIFKLAFDENTKEMTLPYMLVFGIIAYLFIVIKIVYLPLFLLLLFLPKREMSDIRKYIKKLLIILGIVIGLYLVFHLLSPSYGDVASGRTEELASEQIDFVLHHPLQYCGIFLNTLRATRLYIVSTTIGTFGLLDTNLYCVFLGIYLVLMPIIGIFEISLETVKVKILDRCAVIVSVMAAVFGCYLAMYIYWTSCMDGYGVGAQTISGVQGRYFIPMMPVAFLVFANVRLKKNGKLKMIMSSLVDNSSLLSVSMLCVSSVVLLLRFWC